MNCPGKAAALAPTSPLTVRTLKKTVPLVTRAGKSPEQQKWACNHPQMSLPKRTGISFGHDAGVRNLTDPGAESLSVCGKVPFRCQAPLPALPRTGLVASHRDVTQWSVSPSLLLGSSQSETLFHVTAQATASSLLWGFSFPETNELTEMFSANSVQKLGWAF